MKRSVGGRGRTLGFPPLLSGRWQQNEHRESMKPKPCSRGGAELPLRRHKVLMGESHRCDWKIKRAELSKSAKLSQVLSCACLGSSLCPSVRAALEHAEKLSLDSSRE